MLAWGRATQLTQLEISFLCQKLLGSVIERNLGLSCPWLLLHFQHLHHQNVQLILFSSVMPSVLRGKLPLGLCTTHAGCPSRVVTLLYFVLRCRRQTSKNKQFTHLGMTSEHLSTQVQVGSFGQSYACHVVRCTGGHLVPEVGSGSLPAACKPWTLRSSAASSPVMVKHRSNTKQPQHEVSNYPAKQALALCGFPILYGQIQYKVCNLSILIWSSTVPPLNSH